MEHDTEDIEDNVGDYDQLNAMQNRKQKTAGGWQSMGLDHTVFKGILRKGYRQPTPIQRKAIPLLCDGRDVVAMSRTGSGKTAAFVVPLLQRLKRRDTRGIRALLFSPTRELALQTFKIVKELGRFTGLYCACLIGGDSMDEQFDVLHQHPDILIATPGRLLHLVVEMNLKLNTVQHVVFDEADRLFELGFADQLKEVLKRIPESRQTLLFSATLPKMLIDFAKAGLSDPELVRLDVESKLSDKLSMAFALCRQMEKLPVLLNLCRVLVRQKKKTIVFCATMKHVEHVVAVFEHANLAPTYLYSQLDPTARKQNIARFRDDECFLLIVTDIAARGVDIPLLDFAVNYHFPPKPKLFVHRVGRVARAGKSGTSISFVSPDEMAYLVDLFLFLGRPMQFVQPDAVGSNSKWNKNTDSVLIGTFPDTMAHLETEFLRTIEQNSIEIVDLQRKAENAMVKYQRTRTQPSAESVRRVKAEFRHIWPGPHPFFVDPVLFPDMALEQRMDGDAIVSGHDVLVQLKSWRPNQAIFELRNTLGSSGTITAKQCKAVPSSKQPSRAEQRKAEERAEHFVDYVPTDVNSERGLALGDSSVSGDTFENAAREAAVDMGADDEKGMHMDSKRTMWDRKRKKFVSAEKGQPKVKKMRTEEGTLLPVSYKSGRYEKWKRNQRMDIQRPQEDEGEGGGRCERAVSRNGDHRMGGGAEFNHQKKGRHNSNNRRFVSNGKMARDEKSSGGGGRGELRNIDQITKARRKKAAIHSYQSHRKEENANRRERATANRRRPTGGGRSGHQGSRGGRGRSGGQPSGRSGQPNARGGRGRGGGHQSARGGKGRGDGQPSARGGRGRGGGHQNARGGRGRAK